MCSFDKGSHFGLVLGERCGWIVWVVQECGGEVVRSDEREGGAEAGEGRGAVADYSVNIALL